MKIYLFIIVLSCLCMSATSPSEYTSFSPTKTPRVFLIEEEMETFDDLSERYEMALLTACNNDLDKAYRNWNEMLKAMEEYAKLWNYDIRGVKIWVKVFCNKKGYIEYIGYSVKSSSRNLDTELFNRFLERFLRAYRLDLRSSQRFSHYGRASFPVRR